MSLETDYTLGTYNSYITELEADDIAAKYATYYPGADWSALTPTDKESWLLTTAAEANTEWGYEGELISKVVSTESGGMQWPRRGATHANGLGVAETQTPTGVKEFQVVRTLEYLANPALISTGVAVGAIKKQKLDVLEQEFFEPSSEAGTKVKRSSMLSYKLLLPYLAFTSLLGSTKAVVRA